MSNQATMLTLAFIVFGLTAANLTLAILFFRHLRDHEANTHVRADRQERLRRYCSTYHRWPINR